MRQQSITPMVQNSMSGVGGSSVGVDGGAVNPSSTTRPSRSTDGGVVVSSGDVYDNGSQGSVRMVHDSYSFAGDQPAGGVRPSSPSYVSRGSLPGQSGGGDAPVLRGQPSADLGSGSPSVGVSGVREDDGIILACLKSTTLSPVDSSEDYADKKIEKLSKQLVAKIYAGLSNNSHKMVPELLLRPIYDILLDFTPEKREVFRDVVLKIADYLMTMRIKDYSEWSFYDFLKVLQTFVLQGQGEFFLEVFEQITRSAPGQYANILSLKNYQQLIELIYLQSPEDQEYLLRKLNDDFTQHRRLKQPWDLDVCLALLAASLDMLISKES